VSIGYLLGEQQRIVVHLNGLQTKLNVLRELQSARGMELFMFMPSILG
jgi:hypothetical protein